MTDSIADIIGQYRTFAVQQRDRLLTRGIDISPYTLSRLASQQLFDSCRARSTRADAGPHYARIVDNWGSWPALAVVRGSP